MKLKKHLQEGFTAPDFTKLSGNERNTTMLRTAIIAELDAISLYNEMATLTDNEDVKKILLDISHEEKIHVGELKELLERLDKEQKTDTIKGKEEVADKLKK
jgi:rubrerythrin